MPPQPVVSAIKAKQTIISQPRQWGETREGNTFETQRNKEAEEI
jgi:hypothetical protein